MALAPTLRAADVSFQLIATEFADGVPWLKPGIPIPISEDGKVVFPTQSLGTFDDQLHSYVAGTLTPISLTAGGHAMVNSIALNSDGNVAFVANRSPEPGTNYRGVYKTTAAGAPITTYHEDLQEFGSPGPAARFVAMSDNGTTAFSTIVSGVGEIYRGDISASPSLLRNGSGAFYNTQRIDVNDAGTTAVQIEYSSPVGGADGGSLARAILAIDVPDSSPAPDVKQTRSVVEQTSVGVQPMPSINSSGQIAFALNTTISMKFYDPPNVANPATLVETITLAPGVYVSEPVGLGLLPRSYTQIADALGDFNTFGRVVINDAGQVIFEASLDGGTNAGIFAGGDPVADEILLQGDSLGVGPAISIIQLGDLNNAGQFTFLTSRVGGDRQVWIGTIPEPATLGVLGIAGLIALGRKRDSSPSRKDRPRIHAHE